MDFESTYMEVCQSCMASTVVPALEHNGIYSSHLVTY